MSTAEIAKPPVVDLDPYAADVLESPYRFHEDLREAAPVVWLEKYGVYALGRHDEARIVLSDYARFTAMGGIGIQDIREPGDFRIPSRLLENDPPNHTEIRKVVQKVLSPLVVKQWREAAESIAAQVVAEALEKEVVDGVEDLVEAFVLRAFPEVVGVTLPRTETLAIGEMRFNQSGPRNELTERALEAAQPYLAWFDQSCSRQGVRPGSISETLFEIEEAGGLPEGVASNIVRSFVGGGTDSTISGISTAVRHLAADPEQWQILQNNPSKAKIALDEAVRVECPFHVTYRTTTGPVELGGLELTGNSKIGVFLGAANRDPRRWEEPGKFDLMRAVAGSHNGFGTGDHNCIGQMLARLEAEALLTALARGAAKIELAADYSYRPMNQMRTLKSLPLRLTPA